MAAVAHDRTAANGMGKESFPLCREQAVFLAYWHVILNLSKINDELRPENLPYTLSLIGIRCAQQDFDTIISILKSRGVYTINDFIALANPKRLETIRNTYITVTGRPPDSFELIASLGSLKGIPNGENEIQHVESLIEYSRFWNKFRKQFVSGKNSPRSYD